MQRWLGAASAIFYAILALGLPQTARNTWVSLQGAPSCALGNSGHSCQCLLDQSKGGICCCNHGHGRMAEESTPGASSREQCAKLAGCGTPAPAMGLTAGFQPHFPLSLTGLQGWEPAGKQPMPAIPALPSPFSDPPEKIPIA